MEAKTKKSIRKEYLDIRAAMPEEECIQKSRTICERILQEEFYRRAKVIYAYMAFRNEVDLMLLMHTAYLEHKLVAIPRITDGWMTFHCPKMAADGSFVTEIGYFDIQEPAEDAPLAPRPDLMLFPGAVFDRDGGRIGYGKGYYDAYMAALQGTAVTTVGAAYECQMTEHIPTEEHDFSLQYIMTESGLYKPAGGSQAMECTK